MLALNLLPGTGLGCFSLGCSINQALINIRQAQTTFGCVELKYFEKTTSLDDILLNLPEHGVHLIFESSSQTLRLIEVYDLSRLQVKRGAATVGGSAHPPTFQALYDLMGPTYPGQVDTAHGCYVMHWPGLLVLFPIASQHAASWQDMQQGRALPLALPDGTAPVASRLCIHAGNAAVSLGDLVQAISPANFESPPSVGIRVGKGLTMDDTHQQLSFGDSPQDAWSTLGAPNATFSKQTPGLPQQGSANIRGAQQQVPASPADYFYNYFDRGLDVLFCGTTHRIKKMVLHTNCPNHTSFGTYSKCHFTLHAQSSTTHKALQQDGMSSDATSQQKSDSRSPFGDNTGGPEGFWDHQHNGQADESQEAQVLYGGKPILQPDYLEAWLDPDLPVQDWMLQAEGAHKSASSPDYSPAAPAAVQQALLDDIKAMTRADSDAGSSDSSMTQEGAPFSAGTVPQTGEVTPPSHPPDAQGTDRASLGAVDKASPQPQRQQTTGGAPSVPRQHHSAKVDCRHEEEEQQAQQLPEVEARAELAGSGESAPVDFGDEGGSAGDVGSEGWDDADPMAMLSQSVQSLARAQQAESELRSSEPAQHVVMQSGSVAAGTPRADPHSHTSSEVLSARLVGAAETGQTALSSNSIRQDASSWTAQEVPSGIMPEHPEAASETVLVSAGESAELQSRGSRSGSYDGNDANSSAQAGNGLAGGLESACLEHDASASVLTADSTWAEVENVLGKGNRAVIHTRGVGGGPYGPTMVHGYPGIVFEVTQAGQVASVTLFDF